MRGKLIKTRDNGFLTYVLKGEDKRTIAMTRYPFPSESIYLAKSYGIELQKLSPENCDEIFGIVDFEKLAEEYARTAHDIIDEPYQNGLFYGFMTGSKKTMELNKDKMFTLEDIYDAVMLGVCFEDSGIEGISTYEELKELAVKRASKPTEIEVEIEMKRIVDKTKVIGVVKGVKGSGDKIKTYKTVPKLDSNGCLILKKI
jgi:hypothetical protein